jgi:hypothetical protein
VLHLIRNKGTLSSHLRQVLPVILYESETPC